MSVVASIVVLSVLPSSAAQAAVCAPSWALTPSWTHDDSYLFQAASDGNGDAMAAGYRYILNTAYRPLIERWTGTSWAVMTTPSKYSDDTLSGIAVNSATSAVAVGWYAPNSNENSRAFAEIWNGSSWSLSFPPTFRSAPNVYLSTALTQAASTSPTNVWAVGNYISASHVQIPVIEHLGTGGWTLTKAGAIGTGAALFGVATDSATDAWAVGEADQSSVQGPLAERWNGTSWQALSPAAIGVASQLNAVAIAAPNDVWAVGWSYNGSATVPISTHWNGTTWTAVAIPSSAPYATLSSVTALGPRDVWAFGTEQVGQFGGNAPLIEHWNGSSWSAVVSAPGTPPSGSDGYLNGSTYTSGHLLAVGYNQPTGTAAGSTAAQQMCPAQVQDAGFSPTTATTSFGQPVYWTLPSSNTASHSVTDNDGTGVFDSGLIPPGGSFTQTFVGAGLYKVIDTATGHVGSVGVPMTAAPTSGTTTTTFNIQWASSSAPPGFVYDVQVERPGTGAFVNWMVSQTGTGAGFTPDAGAGTYVFRARLRKLVGGAHSFWSPNRSIAVS